MARTLWRALLLGSGVLFVQAGGCSLFDGLALERILWGTVFNPLSETVFDAFYSLGTPG